MWFRPNVHGFRAFGIRFVLSNRAGTAGDVFSQNSLRDLVLLSMKNLHL